MKSFLSRYYFALFVLFLFFNPVLADSTNPSFYWPANKHEVKVTQKFNQTHPGIDLASNNKELLPVFASTDGVVIDAGFSKTGYGNMVIIKHLNGYQSLYAHLSSITVKEGNVVISGQLIGYMGDTGNSTGIKLHFEICGIGDCDYTAGGNRIDPEKLLQDWRFEASFVSQTQASNTDPSFHVKPSDAVTVEAKFKNTGTTTWLNSGNNEVTMAIYKDTKVQSGPKGSCFSNPNTTCIGLGKFGESYFYNSSWHTSSRISSLVEKEVKPGDIGTFKLTFKIPADAPAGTYREDITAAYGTEWMDNFTNGDEINKAHVWVGFEVFGNASTINSIDQTLIKSIMATLITTKEKNWGKQYDVLLCIKCYSVVTRDQYISIWTTEFDGITLKNVAKIPETSRIFFSDKHAEVSPIYELSDGTIYTPKNPKIKTLKYVKDEDGMWSIDWL